MSLWTWLSASGKLRLCSDRGTSPTPANRLNPLPARLNRAVPHVDKSQNHRSKLCPKINFIGHLFDLTCRGFAQACPISGHAVLSASTLASSCLANTGSASTSVVQTISERVGYTSSSRIAFTPAARRQRTPADRGTTPTPIPCPTMRQIASKVRSLIR